MKENQFLVKVNSRMSDQDLPFTRCLAKSCHKLSKFVDAHSKLSIRGCILNQIKGHAFESFLGAITTDPSFSLHAKICN